MAQFPQESFTFPTERENNGYNSSRTSHMEKSRENGYGNGGHPGEMKEGQRRTPLQNMINVVLRLLTFASCIAGFVVMIRDNQTAIVPYPLNGVIVQTVQSAKWHYSSAFVWFVIATGLTALYALISTLVAACLAFNKSGSRSSFLLWAVFIFDLMMLNILMSALSSSIAVGVLGQYGNTHTQWAKICNNFDRFCNHVTGALVAAGAGFVFLLQLCILDAYDLYIQHRRA